MGLVQAVNILAIVTILILVKRSNRICPHHLLVAENDRALSERR
jgi:hypothetical protein